MILISPSGCCWRGRKACSLWWESPGCPVCCPLQIQVCSNRFILHKKTVHSSSLLIHFTQRSSNVSSKLLQQKCKKKTSPRVIPTCESVHTVNKEVRTTRRRKRIILHRQVTKNNVIYSVATQLACGGKCQS